MKTKLTAIGPIEIKLQTGDYLYTEVCREGDKLGTYTNNSFLRDPWEVKISDHGSQQAAMEELYAIIDESVMYA
jgi:hypothetical protein